MCGIVGTFGTGILSWGEKKILNDLFLLDSIRGRDSSGACFLDGGYSPRVFKSLGIPVELEENENYVKEWSMAMKGFIGHNRAATVGKVSVENAHPFHVNHIIGVHNGTLTYDGDLVQGKQGSIDSERIMFSLAEHGVDWTWARVHGAATLVWWNLREHSLNLLTNGKRPFSYAYLDNTRFFFASEGWMIEHLILRKFPEKKLKLNTPKLNTHYKIQIGKKNKISWSVREVSPPKFERRANTQHFGFSGRRSYHRFHHTVESWWDDDDYTMGSHHPHNHRRNMGQGTSTTIQRTPLPANKSTDTEFKNRVKGFWTADKKFVDKKRMRTGGEMTKSDFDKLDASCIWCTGPVDWDSSVIYDEDSIACSDCFTIASELGMAQ